jgi:parallel beta-helix repeat protein
MIRSIIVISEVVLKSLTASEQDCVVKRRNLLSIPLILALLGLAMPVGASVIHVSGDVNGTWSADTVIMTADVRVPLGQNLIIIPGVKVLSRGYYKLIVDSNATLQAVGTPTDSILFDVLPPDTIWHGIHFQSASNSSRLEYCHLTHGYTGSGEDHCGGGIDCSNSSPTISHNTIKRNAATWAEAYGYGGGIFCSNSSPTISYNAIIDNTASGRSGGYGGGIGWYFNSNPIVIGNAIIGNSALDVPNRYQSSQGGGIWCASNGTISGNTISGNTSSAEGGGIMCNESNPTISHNIIRDNLAFWGGGIFSIHGDFIISNCTIYGNSASDRGGGIYCDESSPTIRGNTIRDNWASMGGGIACTYGNPIISNCIISGNAADSSGGGICHEYHSNAIIRNCTFSGNSADSSGGGIYCDNSSPTLVNCILWGNGLPQMHQDPDSSNLQATYSDIQDTLWPGIGNISIDPLFVDMANGDFHLQSTWASFHSGSWLPDSRHSPCIDAGDSTSPYDNELMPNGGRVNLGFEGNTAEASLSSSSSVSQSNAGLPREFRLCAPFPNPFNPLTTIAFDLSKAAHISLRVFDVLGREVAVLKNGIMEAGSHHVIFDGSNFATGIYFVRLEAGAFSQTKKLMLLK